MDKYRHGARDGIVNDSSESTRVRFVPWVVIGALAAGVWSVVAISGVLSRELDGGIFLATTAGIRRGLPLYSGVWDNKDPLFYGAMAAFASVWPVLAFMMDWFWLPVAAGGTVLIARRVVSLPTAVLVGGVAAPFLLIGPSYVPGLTNTPGTAVALLCLGLLINRWYLWAGIGMGLLLFLKVTVFPVVVLCALVLLVFPALRRGLVRVGLGLLGSVVVVVGLMAALGWLPGYFTMLQRNRDYVPAVISYFGFADSPFGHLTKLSDEWKGNLWLAGIVVALILLAGLVSLWMGRLDTPPEPVLTVIWLVLATIGIAAMLAMTYAWQHHAQAAGLVLVLAVIVLAQVVESIPWRVVSWVVILLATFLLSGWSSPTAFIEGYQGRLSSFEVARAGISDVPEDALLLKSVPAATFTFARLGTNDDRGFLWDAPASAVLGCPEFHVYDFSPAETYTRVDNCLRTVDVILKADSFDAFASGGNRGNVPSILEYVRINFTCITLDDRQLCTRKSV
jgi:hypothetical protein